jgi:hypothetical protein
MAIGPKRSSLANVISTNTDVHRMARQGWWWAQHAAGDVAVSILCDQCWHKHNTYSVRSIQHCLWTATRYELDCPGIEFRWGGEIFRIHPDRPWGPPSLLYNRYRVSLPGVKRPGRGVNHPPPPSAEVKERVDLYLYSTSGPSWPVPGRTWIWRC